MQLVHLPNTFGSGAENMAIDSTLLQAIPDGYALFRHYGWTEPTLTFGYTQRFREISQLAPQGVSLSRRPTAGGIVDHRNDWTYSLVLHTSLPAAQLPLAQIYTSIHESLQNAFKKQGIRTQLAPCPKQCSDTNTPQEEHPHCFTKPVADDLLCPESGVKIAGAAIKRSRCGILLQGSVDRATLPHNFQPALFSKHLAQSIAEKSNLTIQQMADLRPLFPQPLLNETRKLYAGSQWLQKR